MNSLKGKSVIITGAGQGIGAACAMYFAREGASVVVNDVDATLTDKVVADIRADAAEGLVKFCVEQFGKLDGLVNNAGLFHLASALEESEMAFRRLMEVNVMGFAWCGMHALRQMVKQGHGSLVNATSGSQSGMAGGGAYGGSKGAVAAMTYSWACDARAAVPAGEVRVNAISPMAFTRMSQVTDEYTRKRGGDPSKRHRIDPEFNAPLIGYLLSDYSKDVNGQVVRVQEGEISLVSHPAVMLPSHVRDSWSIEDVRDAFAADLSQRQFPLGPLATEVTYKPYKVTYST
jgi:NAD(P)-dependent dehydrogenase (short-subunit alcohol dehydrogenase family)